MAVVGAGCSPGAVRATGWGSVRGHFRGWTGEGGGSAWWGMALWVTRCAV